MDGVIGAYLEGVGLGGKPMGITGGCRLSEIVGAGMGVHI